MTSLFFITGFLNIVSYHTTTINVTTDIYY